MSSSPQHRSITSLIPLPPSPQSSNASLRENRPPTPSLSEPKWPVSLEPYPRPHPSRNEENIDKFATLFSPATPPASPALEPVTDEYIFTPHTRPPTRPKRTKSHPETPGSADSEFGSFVSVGPGEDPLGLAFSPISPSFFPFTSAQPQSSSSPSPSRSPIMTPSTSSSLRMPRTMLNPSLDFFDKFAEEAKRNSERNKKEVLDELLEHEDDPLFWLKSPGDVGNGVMSEPDGGHDETPVTDVALVDLDDSSLDDTDSGRISRQPDRSGHEISPSVRRSSSHPPLPQVRESPEPESDALPPSTPIVLPRPGRISVSKSHGSINTLPSRLSSLLSSSRPSLPSTSPTQHRSLDTLFSNDPSIDSMASLHPLPPGELVHKAGIPIPSPGTRKTPSPRASHPTSSSLFTPSISHGTPFASHAFVPISGAPGFSGDREWDKGFSKDWDRGEAEKKSVTLSGRKDATEAVLSGDVAGLVRPHLPALSRLPRSWTLLYSLDQHGISLNTLYTRCENQYPKTTGSGGGGALVVMKDSGDAVFGAWMGDGIRLSKGAYYGSGESFLWKYVDDQIHVFKWTGKNDYVALCEPEFLSFGGGDGHYGLYLDDTLLDGSSAPCPTFDNEPLCSDGQKKGGSVPFECVGLEVWAVGP